MKITRLLKKDIEDIKEVNKTVGLIGRCSLIASSRK
jgi:hypothetical protein